MKKIRHTKLKNTGILFELLVRQITSDTLNNVSESIAGKLIRKYFHKNSPLSAELSLYQTLLSEKFNKINKAEALVEACLTARKKINEKSLSREKYNLIKSIKENWNIDEFFGARVNNYRILASVYKLFEYNLEDNPKLLIDSKFTLLEHISKTKISNKKQNNTITEKLSKESNDIRNLTYKFLIEKFNNKYGKLSSRQKKLLEIYINNDSGTNTLKKFVNEQVIYISELLKQYNKSIDDSITKIKINESIQILEDINKSKRIQDKDVLSLLRYYDLISEIKKIIGE